MEIIKYLEDKGVPFETRKHREYYTAEEEAASLNVAGSMFAKTVIVKAGAEYVMLVLPASHQVNLERAEAVLGRPVVLAAEKALAELFPDCELGAEPPFGSIYGLRTFVDHNLGRHERIAVRACTHTDVVLLPYRDYERLERPQVAEFAELVGVD
jgi:Ala-tRNA(Pro) deacylase